MSFAAACSLAFFAQNPKVMDIKLWINDPNRSYKTGLEIYHKVKRDKQKDAFFNSVSNAAPGSLHHNLLLKAIKNAHRIILANGIQLPADKKPPLPTKPITTIPLSLVKPTHEGADKARFVHNELIDVKSLPPHMQNKYIRNQQITREMAGLHQKLKEPSTDSQRQATAESIQQLFIERRNNWKDLDAYVQGPSGASSEDAPSPSAGMREQKDPDLAKRALVANQRVKTVKINIARVEKELQKKDLSAAKVKARKSRLAAWKKELLELDDFLSSL